MTQLKSGSDDYQSFQQTIQCEWLISNGIGGFACGTICEAYSRRYHGLLMASLTPPHGTNLVSIQA